MSLGRTVTHFLTTSSLCRSLVLACSLRHSLRLILSGRYIEGGTRDVMCLLPFMLCIYCIGSKSYRKS